MQFYAALLIVSSVQQTNELGKRNKPRHRDASFYYFGGVQTRQKIYIYISIYIYRTNKLIDTYRTIRDRSVVPQKK